MKRRDFLLGAPAALAGGVALALVAKASSTERLLQWGSLRDLNGRPHTERYARFEPLNEAAKAQVVWISGLEERLYGHAMLRREGFEYNYAFTVNGDATEWRRDRPQDAKELFISKDRRLIYRGIDYVTRKWWRG